MKKKDFNKNLAANRILLIMFSIWHMRASCGIQIFYLQESAASYAGSSYSSIQLSSLSTSFTVSMQYTMSSWVNLHTIPTDWTTLFKLSLNYSAPGYDERLLIAQVNSADNDTFSVGLPTIQFYDWTPWEDLTSQQIFPTNQWVFLALGTDSTKNMQYGFTYYLQSPTNQNIIFRTRTLSGPSYNATPTCTAFWGGDTFGLSYGQQLQFVRLYIDYVPNSQDQMLNLAIMEPGGTLYYPLFTTDYADVQNTTTPVQYYNNLTQGSLTTPINSTYLPKFGPYNMLMCRPGALFSQSTGGTNSNGIIVAFDIKIYSPATNFQGLFSVRHSANNNYISLITYYNSESCKITIRIRDPSWIDVYTSTTVINLDEWTRVVVELQKSNPEELGTGYNYSGRIFINQSIPNRAYFANPSTPLFQDSLDETLDICGVINSGDTTLDSNWDGNYDMMNFMWYQGEESLFQNSSDQTCFLSGFLSPNQSACLICNTGYFLNGRDCVSSCSANQFVSAGTNSCQSCYYPGRYYTNTGYCLPCNLTNQLISGYSCIICDPSCATCTGPSPTQCQSCYARSYLLSSNSSCVACSVNGYYISEGTICSVCNSSCSQCYGPLAINCLSCLSGTYLLPSNNSCVSCNVNGYYISGSQCLENSVNNFSTSAGKIVGNAVLAQSVASSILPAVISLNTAPAITGGVSTSGMLLIGFLADVDLYKYLNVPFPDDFATFCEEISAPILPNIFAKMDTVNGGNNPNSTIGKFQFWGVSATLLDNSYASIAKELITLAIVLGLNILVFIIKDCPRFHQAMCKIRTVFMWNVFLSYYLGDFSELQLNSMIQMRENYVSSAYADLSLAFAVLIVATYPALFGYALYKLNRRFPQLQQAKEQEHSQLQNNSRIQTSKNSRTQEQRDNSNLTLEEHFNEQWVEVPPSIKIIAEDFSGKNRFTRNFILIMVLEYFLLILLVFFFQDYGLAQAILYTIIITILVFLTAWQRPYKSLVQMGIILLNLSTKTIMGVFAIIFGINDKTQFFSSSLIEITGLILIALILIVIGINVVVSLVIMVVSAYKGYKEWRASKKDIRSSPKNKAENITPRRNIFMANQEEQPKANNISLEFHSGSILQSSKQIHHQSYDEEESQSTPQTNKQSLIRKDLDVDSSRSKIVSKKSHKNRSHLRGLARNITNKRVEANNVSLEFHSGSILQSSKNIHHQSYHEDESQSIPQTNVKNLIRRDLDVDSSRSKIVHNKTHNSTSNRRGLARNITNKQVDKNMMAFDINFIPSPSREVLSKSNRNKTNKHQ